MRHLLRLIFGLILGVSAATAQESAFRSSQFDLTDLENKYATEYSTFLSKMGYEDYSNQAYRTLLALKNAGQISPEKEFILNRNTQRFNFLDGIHDFVTLMMAKLETSSDKGQAIDHLIAMTVFTLKPFPLMGLEPLKSELMNVPRGEDARKLRKKILEEKSQGRYRSEKSIILSLALKVMFSDADVRTVSDHQDMVFKLDNLITEAVSYQYEYASLQQNRYLGKALALALMKYAAKNNDLRTKALLKVRSRGDGVILENYITDTVTLTDNNNGIHNVRLRSGDLAVEMSVDALSYAISVGTNPTHPADKKLAEKLDIIPSSALAPAFVSDFPYKSVTEKIKSNIELTESDERNRELLWDPKSLKGFSHAGLIEVRRDVESGLATVWIWDIYPDRNRAGMRLMTVDSFAYPEKYHRIGFVRYSAEKLLQSLKRQIVKRGFMSTVWQSFETNHTKEQGYVLNRNKRYHWPSLVDEKTVMRWSQLSDSDAEKWYHNEVGPRITALLKSYFVGADALAYSQDFLNGESMAYCSQMPLLAYLQATNIDLQEYPENWGKLAKVARVVRAIRYDLSERIVSPNGLVWQSGIVERASIIDFNRSRVETQKLNHPENNYQMTVADARIYYGKSIVDEDIYRAVMKSHLVQDISTDDIDIDDDEF